MRQSFLIVLLTSLIASAASGDEPKIAKQPDGAGEGLTTLFNGRDFTGWRGSRTMDRASSRRCRQTTKRKCSPRAPRI